MVDLMVLTMVNNDVSILFIIVNNGVSCGIYMVLFIALTMVSFVGYGAYYGVGSEEVIWHMVGMVV